MPKTKKRKRTHPAAECYAVSANAIAALCGAAAALQEQQQ